MRNLRSSQLTAIIVLAFAASGPSPTSAEAPEHIQQKVDSLTRNWRMVTPEVLRDPANSEALERLRIEAKHPHRTDARVPLLRIGDTEVVRQCLEEFHTKSSGRRQVARQLELSGNPELIAILANDLFRDESTVSTLVSPEFLERPISVYAADAILGIIKASSQFSVATKAWAASLEHQPSAEREGVRVAMRKWWLQNKRSLIAGK